MFGGNKNKNAVRSIAAIVLLSFSFSASAELGDYGFWKTTLKTLKYDFISTNSINQEELTLIFIRYNDEKLQEEIFRTSLAISIVDSELIFNKLNEIKLDEFGHEVNFPIIFPN